ncbi:MAG: hypothetical protein WCO61_01190 [Alphaproteobacteria bacterium]
MSEIKLRGDLAQFQIAEIDTELAASLAQQSPTSSDIQSIFKSKRHKTYNGFRLDANIIYNNDVYDLDELDGVQYDLKRISTKDMTLLFYGIAWKDELLLEKDLSDDYNYRDIPIDVIEYRLNKNVSFKLIDVPKTVQIHQGDDLVVENAAIQFSNNRLVELISVRNDY